MLPPTAVAVMTGPKDDTITKELAVHVNKELQYALQVAQPIADVGDTPTMDIKPREVAADARTMLKKDLKGEEQAIALYKDLIV